MTLLLNPTFLLGSAFMAFVLQVMMNFWFDVPLLTNVTSTETETEAAITRNLNILQSHPRCGLTFDKGREECWWGCDRKQGTEGFGQLYLTVRYLTELDSDDLHLLIKLFSCQDPVCLENCHVPGQDQPNCIQSLIADYKKHGGVCPNSDKTRNLKFVVHDHIWTQNSA